MTSHVLYRFFDAQGEPLYIGMTGNFAARLISHEATKPWFVDVVAIQIERFPTREALAEAEARAIRAEQPKHNAVRFVGPTKLRTFRVDGELWEAAKRTAEEEGRTLTAVIAAALQEYSDS